MTQRLCPHHLPIDDCQWCRPARVVENLPPGVLADLGGEHVSDGNVPATKGPSHG